MRAAIFQQPRSITSGDGPDATITVSYVFLKSPFPRKPGTPGPAPDAHPQMTG
jgi:hypothetical protein